MDSAQEFPPQSSQLQPTERTEPRVTNEATNQRPSNDLGGGQEELVRESFRCSTPDHSKNQLPLYQVSSTTPVVRRIASYRHFLPSAAPARGRVSAREMGVYLAIELDRVKPIRIVDLPNIVFPNSSLPFPVDENLLQQLDTVWNSQKKVLNPPIAYTEQAI